jgi:hypothetical protein
MHTTENEHLENKNLQPSTTAQVKLETIS